MPILKCASDVEMKAIIWLWCGYLALGKIHITGGQPGTGKTTIALNIAATITIGGILPDGTKATIGDVLIWSGEDAIDDTLVPRLKAMGADLSRIHFIDGITEDGKGRNFDPAKDMQHINGVIKTIPELKLLIVDPIVSVISGDSHKNAEVRRGLQPLVDFADKYNVAVIGITHLSKGSTGKEPLERIIGSIAFGAVARIAYIAAKLKEQGADGEETEYRAFVRAKSNISKDGNGFRYLLKQHELANGITTSIIEWGCAINGEAREILSHDAGINTNASENISTLEEAKKFLKEYLIEGGASAKFILLNAREAGFSESTIRRAKEALKVISFKKGKDGWYWKLPSYSEQDAHEDAQDVQEKTLSTFEHLPKVEHLQTGHSEYSIQNNAAALDKITEDYEIEVRSYA